MDAKNIFSGSLVGLRMGNETTLVYLTENVATINPRVKTEKKIITIFNPHIL